MKFKIEEEVKEESTNKCIRFPKKLIKEINKATNNKITFSKFVIDACQFALDNIDNRYSD